MKKEDLRLVVALALLVAAGAATVLFSGWVESGGSSAAAAPFLSQKTAHEVALYADRAVPSDIEIDVGDEVVFVVKEGYHNMAEERSDRKDARLQSGELDSSTTYSLSFGAPGTISLYDRLNLDIRVTIRVK